jgi:hypothetical protein
MIHLRKTPLPILSLSLAVVFLQACGQPAQPTQRTLVSVTISPGTAAPANGQTQFVATGHYNTAPYTVAPLDATWGIPQPAGTIKQNGLAACSKGAAGTTTVEAWVQVEPAACNSIDEDGRPGCGNIGGTAQFTCP